MNVFKFYHKKYQKYAILLAVSVATILGACKKSPDAYNDLRKTLQIGTGGEFSYQTSYAIGDTITIYGRFTTDTAKLALMIGGKKARIVSAGKYSNSGYNTPNKNLTVDNDLFRVRAIITPNLTTGKNQPVIIISDGSSVQGPPVEIIAFTNLQAFTKPLEIVPYFTPPVEDTSFFMNLVNGKGSIYSYDRLKGFRVIHKGNLQADIPVTLADAEGSFSIIQVVAGAVDPQEKFMYAYAETTDKKTITDTALVFRLLKIDLNDHKLSVINRSVYGKNDYYYSLKQGNVNSIRLGRLIRDMWADQNGNLYFLNLAAGSRGFPITARGSALFRLTAQGDASALFDEKTKLNIDLSSFTNLSGISADGTTLYLNSYVPNSTSDSEIIVYDILARSFIYVFNPAASSSGLYDTKYIGPFTSLQFELPAAALQGCVPGSLFMPMPANRLLFYYFGANKPTLGKGLPDALITLDFDQNQAYKYAPDTLADKDYYGSKGSLVYGSDPYNSFDFFLRFYDTGKLLNYDEEGTIYMELLHPANAPYEPGQLEVVKTKLKQ